MAGPRAPMRSGRPPDPTSAHRRSSVRTNRLPVGDPEGLDGDVTHGRRLDADSIATARLTTGVECGTAQSVDVQDEITVDECRELVAVKCEEHHMAAPDLGRLWKGHACKWLQVLPTLFLRLASSTDARKITP